MYSMSVRPLMGFSIVLFLTGCISFSSSESPTPEYINACLNKEQQCQSLCADKGVQTFNCSARPGEGLSLKCECRNSRQAL